jgi:hypothetical protein
MSTAAPTPDRPAHYTTTETADLRRRTPQALANERARGEGPPYIRDGNKILYPADELDRWLIAHRVDPVLAPKPRRSRSAGKRAATPKGKAS